MGISSMTLARMAGHPGCFVKSQPNAKVRLDVVCNTLQTGAKTLATHQFNDCWSAEYNVSEVREVEGENRR